MLVVKWAEVVAMWAGWAGLAGWCVGRLLSPDYTERNDRGPFGAYIGGGVVFAILGGFALPCAALLDILKWTESFGWGVFGEVFGCLLWCAGIFALGAARRAQLQEK